MKPQKQKFLHKPEENVFGDCHRTALACLFDLDRDDVPHFLEECWSDSERFHDRCDLWLHCQGYREFRMIWKADSLVEVLTTMKILNPGFYYLLGGTSKTGCGHSVICLDDKIVWDPALNDSGIVGPMEDGFYWISVFIDLRFTAPIP